MGPAMVTTEERLARYLGDIAAELHGPRSRRHRILDELRDGVDQSARNRAVPGITPEAALAAAINEFGYPTAIAHAFQPELAIADVRRILTWLLATGPLVGIWWLILLHPRPWLDGPAALVAAIPVVPLIAIAAAGALATFAATGRLIRWIPEAAPGWALAAAAGVILLVLAGDITVIATAWSRASAEPLGIVAVSVSVLRIAGSVSTLHMVAKWRHRLARSTPAG